MDLRDGMTHPHIDTLLVEEPLEIRVAGLAPLTTMRTPGHDLDLAMGLLLTEGIIGHPGQITTAMHCVAAASEPARESDLASSANALRITLDGPVRPPWARTLSSTSACGVCGTASIDDVRGRLGNMRVPAPPPASELPVRAILDSLSRTQRMFATTGGSHAASMFGLRGGSPDLLVTREDVGRHNAVDKVIGAVARNDLAGSAAWPFAPDLVLATSSRASFEILQKAWAAGIGTVITVSAASTLAVQVAEEAGITLVGMVRGDRANVYTANTRETTSKRSSG